MRIVHFSDWHAKIVKKPLPEADLYVCTGDMLENTDPPPRWVQWPVAEAEKPFQKKWIAKARREWAGIFPNRAPLLIVRGNHDWQDLKTLFDDGSREIYEFFDTPSVKWVNGVRFGGFRGVTEINGCWSDENTERVLEAKCDALGKVDVLVTHGPARGCLDLVSGDRRIGSYAQFHYLMNGGARVHLFGHVHESRGVIEKNGLRLSNAATQVNVVEL